MKQVLLCLFYGEESEAQERERCACDHEPGIPEWGPESSLPLHGLCSKLWVPFDLLLR